MPDSTRWPSLTQMLREAGEAKATVAITLIAISVAWLVQVLLVAIIPLDDHLSNSIGHPAAGDFVAYYAAGTLVAAGEPATAYDFVRFEKHMRSTLRADAAGFAWTYPPFTLGLVGLLGHLPPRAALWAWMAILAGCSALLARVFLRDWRLAVLGVVFPGSTFSMLCGQNGTITALLTGTGLLLLMRRRVAAGVPWGVLVFKPQFALVPALVLLFSGRWLVLAVLSTTAMTLTLTSVAVYGVDVWRAFLESVRIQSNDLAQMRLPIQRMVTAFAGMLTLTHSQLLATFVQACVAGAALFLTLGVWKTTAHLVPRALSLSLCMLLCTPYAYDYDLAVLLVPFLALIRDWRESGDLSWTKLGWLVLLAGLPPSAYFGGINLHFPFVAVILFLCLVVVRYRPEHLMAASHGPARSAIPSPDA